MTDPELVIPLSKSRGELPAVYMIAGEAGHCCAFKSLAKRLKTDWNVFGLLHPRFVNEDERFGSIEDLATRFKAAMGSHDKVIIFGYSLGGGIAIELAHQLEAEGKEVGVVVFDPKLRQLHKIRNPLSYNFKKAARHLRDRLTPYVRPDYYRKRMQAWDATRNFRRYQPRPIKAPIAILTPNNPYEGSPYIPEPNLGLETYGRVVHTDICEGNHWNAFKAPHSVNFAAVVGRALASVFSELPTPKNTNV